MSDMPNEGSGSQRIHIHSDDRPCLKDPSEKLNRSSSDSQIHSLCDEILVSNGTSMYDVLSDWYVVLPFNLSSEEIVILLVNKSLTSPQAATQQRTGLSAQNVIKTIRGQSGDVCCLAEGTGFAQPS